MDSVFICVCLIYNHTRVRDMTQCCRCTLVVFIYLILYVKTTCGLRIYSGVVFSSVDSKMKFYDNRIRMYPIERMLADLPHTKLILL